MKNSIGIFAMIAVMGAQSSTVRDIIRNPTPKKKLSEEDRNRAMGLRKFEYEDGEVWATNQKNADRKAKKLGYIN